ncbi:MAG TPA: AAA family ATPase [Saprospiraceae bacterium]|nr:AAA family ATPase [Saprospiraceae bacterium]HMP25235.1 AAA family ATPase [Saprospiraceae bacterium]
MDYIHYPLLYFKVDENTVLGLLVGTEYEVIDRDLRSVKSVLSKHLQKQYKKFNDYAPGYAAVPKLKVIHLPVKPAYTGNSGIYPMSQSVEVPVVAIYGKTTYGDFECALPMLHRHFHYYDIEQLDALIRHFATGILNQMQADAIYKLLQYPKIQLDVVSLRIKSDRNYTWDGFYTPRTFKTLNSLTEQYPSRQTRRHNALPDAAWELDDQVAQVVDKIIATRSNVLIVGNPGVGKSAVLRQAIRKITNQGKEQQLGYTFWRIMPQRITASAKYLGEWEETCEALVDELLAANGILWVEDMVRLLQIGGGGPETSVAAFLQTFLQQGKLQIIGEATPAELESMRRLLPGFMALFQVVTIEELSEASISRILEKVSEHAARNLKITIKEEALPIVYRLLHRYEPYERFPGKAIRFLSRCISNVQQKQGTQIDKKVVIENFVEQTGLPELFLRDDLRLDQDEMQRFFSSRIIGQPQALHHIANIVKVYKAGLNNPHKPITSLIFAGPTGVGKTAAAKALADYFFGQGQQQSPLIRIDMSELQHPTQISRFIGQGQEIGQLVRESRERPFAVLLLDEVEKAHPVLFDILLGLLDEGMLVDAYGRVTNFRNTIVIMTSNLGAVTGQSLGFQRTDTAEAVYLSAIQQHFRPEFFNRIDDVVIFKPLSQDAVQEIARKELNTYIRREGFLRKGLQLRFTERVFAYLEQAGFSEQYGARPLQKTIEQQITNPIAKWLLKNPDIANCSIEVDYTENGLEFRPIYK